MSNIIQIKKGKGKPAENVLSFGELGFDTDGGYLYIGDYSGKAQKIKAGTSDSSNSSGVSDNTINAIPLTNDYNIKTLAKNTNLDDLKNKENIGVYIAYAATSNTIESPQKGKGIKIYVIQGYSDLRVHQFLFGEETKFFYHRMYDSFKWTAWAKIGVTTLSDLGVTATLDELNKLDGLTASTVELNKLTGLTASVDELNYVRGLTSNIQYQLNNKLEKESNETLLLKNITPLVIQSNDSNAPSKSFIEFTHMDGTMLGKIGYLGKNKPGVYLSDVGEFELFHANNIQTQLKYLLDIGQSIPANSNLNNYKTPSKYYSENSTITASLSNAPNVGSGFGLIVMFGYSNNRIYQILFPNRNTVYMRYYNATAGTWTTWDYLVKGADVEGKVQLATQTDIISSNSEKTFTFDGPVQGVSVTIQSTSTSNNSKNNGVNSFWSIADSGRRDQMYGYVNDNLDSWPTIVTISDNTVKVKRDGDASAKYHVTAFYN